MPSWCLGSLGARRVLVATSSRAVVGGAEVYLRSTLPALRERGLEVGLLFEFAGPVGVATVDSAATGIELFAVEGAADAALARVAGWRPDVVFVQYLTDPTLERALVSRYPSALFGHGYYGTCATGAKRHAFPTMLPCQRRFGAACIPLNYLRRCGTLRAGRLIREYRIQRERHALLPAYGAVLVASRHMRDEFVRHDVPCERVHVLPMPTTDIAADREPPRRREPTSCILLMARLCAEKGGAHLIRAIALAQAALDRRLRLIAAGTGPEKARWSALAARLGVDAEFPGWVGGAKRPALLRSADIVAMPSLWPEPYGLVGPEAGAVGVPAVGYSVGGIPDWLTPSVNGESAPGDPPTVQGLADALVRALRSADHLHHLRVGAWQRARDLTMRRHIDALLLALDTVARPGAPSTGA